VRLVVAAAVAVVGCGRIFGPDYVSPDTLTRGPVAEYTFDDLGTSISMCARDVTGNGHDGDCLGMPTLIPGRIGNAFHLDGQTRISVAATPDLSTPDFTVAVWFNLDSMPTDYVCPVNRPIGTQAVNSWQICITPTGIGFGTNGGYTTVDTPITTHAWHHAALTLNANLLVGSLDGNQVGASIVNVVTFDTDPMSIGADVDCLAVPTAWLTGGIDELRLYDRALSHDEIVGLANP
jgi:hypothetical protein